jgi:hypothetical protein
MEVYLILRLQSEAACRTRVLTRDQRILLSSGQWTRTKPEKISTSPVDGSNFLILWVSGICSLLLILHFGSYTYVIAICILMRFAFLCGLDHHFVFGDYRASSAIYDPTHQETLSHFIFHFLCTCWMWLHVNTLLFMFFDSPSSEIQVDLTYATR